MKRRLLLATALLIFAPLLSAADGDNDFGYASGSVSTIGVTPPRYQMYNPGVALDSDGSVLVASVAGVTNYSDAARFNVVRFLPNGNMDTRFGSGGMAQVDFSNGAANYPAYARRLARTSNGQWLVAGWIGPSFDVGIARLQSNGQLDTSFGDQGRVRYDLGSQDSANVMQVDAQDRIWLLVEGSPNKLLRLRPDGSLDTSWNGSGRLDLPSNPYVATFALDAQGRVLLGGVHFGTPNYSMAVKRLLPDGSTDTSFGEQGLALCAPDARAGVSKLLPLADGRVLVVGNSYTSGGVGGNYGRITVLRLQANGQLDTGYASNGVRIVDFIGDERSTGGPDVQAQLAVDGKLVIVRPVIAPVNAVRIARLLPNGQLDVTFYGSGKRSIMESGYRYVTVADVLLTPQRLLIAGTFNANQLMYYATALRDGDGIYRDGF